MPRRRNRFSRLEQQFRDSGGVADPGSRLAGYIEFKQGKRKITVSQKPTPTQRKRYGVAILPFGVTPATTITASDRYQAAVTVYSADRRTDLGLTNNKLGWETLASGNIEDPEFYPALIRVFVAEGNTTTPLSGITGKEYTRQPGRTYSFPYGRTISDVSDQATGNTETNIDEVDELDVRESLIATVKAANANVKSVSYEPEIFRLGRAPLEALPS